MKKKFILLILFIELLASNKLDEIKFKNFYLNIKKDFNVNDISISIIYAEGDASSIHIEDKFNIENEEEDIGKIILLDKTATLKNIFSTIEEAKKILIKKFKINEKLTICRVDNQKIEPIQADREKWEKAKQEDYINENKETWKNEYILQHREALNKEYITKLKEKNLLDEKKQKKSWKDRLKDPGLVLLGAGLGFVTDRYVLKK